MAALGEILLKRNRITEMQLNHALELQKKSGGRLGDILIGEGHIGYYALYQDIAEHYSLPFVNLLEQPPADDLLVGTIPPELYLRRNLVPWQRTADGVFTIALTDYNEDTAAWCRQQFGDATRFVITSPFDVRRVIETHCGAGFETASRLSLWQRTPQESARETMVEKQRQCVYLCCAVLLAMAVIFPAYSLFSLLALCHIAYAATMFFKCAVFVRGTPPSAPSRWEEKLARLDERELPIYTILIPMYREAESLPGMLAAMQAMEYPAAKLDIKLVLESDDQETLQAAFALKPRYNFDIIRVPPSDLRTKPKACNYALRYARGELVTIFDADDRPDKWQLKKAVYMFRHSPPDVACLQARLNYYNRNENLLTRFFSLEYTILFDFMLIGLQRLGIPIPLGGTSNHIALARLKELGEWDPYNVTEDADLGTRLAARGFKTLMLDSITLEEAPTRIVPWIKQRSRWIKGYMQTWLVHMRSPIRLYRTLGVRGFTGFQFFVGLSCFTFLSAPVLWTLSALWFGSLQQWHHMQLPGWLFWLTGINLVLNVSTNCYLSIFCAVTRNKHALPMLVAALLYPVYLVLHSIASYKALWQLIVKPHFWEKTAHGITRRMDMSVFEQEAVKIRAQTL